MIVLSSIAHGLYVIVWRMILSKSSCSSTYSEEVAGRLRSGHDSALWVQRALMDIS